MPEMIDHSMHTAMWPARVREIQDALRDRKWATALAKIADLQASLIEVDAWVQGKQASAAATDRGE